AAVATPYLADAQRAGATDAAVLAASPVPDDDGTAATVVADTADRLGGELLHELRTTLL
ncbi:MAG: hypothetical protein GWO04_37385, partial [Actinobacteria bacterium]|nr:hypothetical protein [Actinomycetota bacterium]NIW29663.1 hypothetical protein [Actinomycetota bacterium]